MRGHVSDPGGGVGATASAAVRGREAAVTHVVWDWGVAGGLGGTFRLRLSGHDQSGPSCSRLTCQAPGLPCPTSLFTSHGAG